MRKMRIVSLLLTLIMIFSVFPTASAATPSPTFSDVPTSHWAYQYIERASDKGWVAGIGNGKYAPESTVSNAQFMTMLTRAFYGDYVSKIAAGANKDQYWWYPYAQTAWDKKLLPGTQVGTEYDAAPYWTEEGCIPSPISRYDMAYMMSNLMANYGTAATEAQKQAAQTKIGDWSKVPDWYKDAVANVYALGIIAGNSDGCFGGDSSMTRAQAAVVMCRLDEAINGDGTAGVQKPGSQDPEPSKQPSGEKTLSNGKPVTEENVLELLEELKEKYPDGSTYDQNVPYYFSPLNVSGIECAKLAFMLSDEIFGDLPIYKRQNFNDVQGGDLIYCKTASGREHWYMVASSPKDDPDGYWFIVEGGPEGIINWSDYSSTNAERCEDAVNNGTISCVIYTRYPPAGDTTFAMLKGENVQQMMDRINAATPAYREGYLTNGEPISDSNIQSMMSEMEKSMPDGTTWDANEKYDYHSVKLGRGGGCNSFAYAVSDAIFGEDAPLTKHQRFEEIKIGDVIWVKNISGSVGHLVVVISNPDEDGYFDTCDGNNGGKISWDSYSNVQRLMSNPDFSSTTYVYTRY